MYNKWDIYKLSLFLINKLITFMYILIRFLYYAASVYFLYKNFKIITIEFHVITSLINLNILHV